MVLDPSTGASVDAERSGVEAMEEVYTPPPLSVQLESGTKYVPRMETTSLPFALNVIGAPPIPLWAGVTVSWYWPVSIKTVSPGLADCAALLIVRNGDWSLSPVFPVSDPVVATYHVTGGGRALPAGVATVATFDCTSAGLMTPVPSETIW